MAKEKAAVVAQNTTSTPVAPVVNENENAAPGAQAPAADDKKEDVVKEPTIDDLRKVKADALAAANAAEADEKTTDAEKSKLWDAVRQAGLEINKFNAKQEQAKIEAENAKLRNEAIAHVAEVLGKSVEEFTQLIAPSENEQTPNVFLTSLQTIVGVKPIQAKEGQSGKSLVKSATSANGETKNISAEIRALFDSGKSVDEVAKLGYDRKRASDIHWHWRKTQA